jgi:hypothetical protein
MAKHIPVGWPALIPRIAVSDPESLVSFIRHVFAATGDFNRDRPSELHLGGSMLMVGPRSSATPRRRFSTCTSKTLTRRTSVLSREERRHWRSPRTCPTATVGQWFAIHGVTRGRSPPIAAGSRHSVPARSITDCRARQVDLAQVRPPVA